MRTRIWQLRPRPSLGLQFQLDLQARPGVERRPSGEVPARRIARLAAPASGRGGLRLRPQIAELRLRIAKL
eukprot:12636019-Alexandrium_andersonii.AAC.1